MFALRQRKRLSAAIAYAPHIVCQSIERNNITYGAQEALLPGLPRLCAGDGREELVDRLYARQTFRQL